jgi:hypothetical protein
VSGPRDDEPSASHQIDVFAHQIGGNPVHDPIEAVSTTGNTTSPLRIEALRGRFAVCVLPDSPTHRRRP